MLIRSNECHILYQLLLVCKSTSDDLSVKLFLMANSKYQAGMLEKHQFENILKNAVTLLLIKLSIFRVFQTRIMNA